MGDGFGASEVSDGTSDFKDAVVGSGGEAESLHGLMEETSVTVFKGTVLFQVGPFHVGVRSNVIVLESLILDFPGLVNALANGFGRLALFGGAQLL